jgi:hypothetical protein
LESEVQKLMAYNCILKTLHTVLCISISYIYFQLLR